MPQSHDFINRKFNPVEDAAVTSSETEEPDYVKKDVLSANAFNHPTIPGSTTNTNRWLGALQRTTGLASRQAVFRSMQSAMGNRSSTVVARLYNQAKGVVQRFKIAGYTVSGHGSDRGSQRGIPNSEIKSAIENGTQYDDGTGKGGIVFYEGDVAVVTMGMTIVTVYRTPSPNKPKARWTAL